MTGRTPSSTGVWERHRQAASREILEVATRLFIGQGFETTTIDQIAAEVGISTRTLFRYFGTKEDILLGGLEAQGEVIQRALEARPAGEGPWEALRAVFAELHRLGRSEEEALALARVLRGTPSLRARSIEKHLHWQTLLVPNIRQRLGTSGDELDPAADAIVACALTCLDVAGTKWAQSGGTLDRAELFDAAVRAVRT